MERGILRLAIIAVFAGWFVLVLWIGLSGGFLTERRFAGLSAVQAAIAGPIVLFWILYGLLPALRHFLRTADLVSLTALQVARVLALAHLVSWGYGLMAGGFAIPVALGNFVVFLLAMWCVPAVAQSAAGWHRRVWILTIVGLAEFAMTVGLAVAGLFTAATALDPATAPGGYVSFRTPPLSLFPTYAIPALSVVHCMTIVALRHQSGRVAADAGHAQPV